MDYAARRLPATVVDPHTVGREFVLQYYHIMYNMPGHLHRFYQDNSKLGRVGQDGVMRVFSTIQDITEELKTLSYGVFKSAELTSFDTQESHSGGFLLAVNGYFTLNERLRRKFIQTFFLAPQENGYFVLNDIFRFVNEPEAIDREVVSGKDSAPHCPVNAPTGNQSSGRAASVSVNPVYKDVPKLLYNKNASVANGNVVVPEIISEEDPNIELMCKVVADYGLEDLPKKSYASVLKVMKDKSGVSAGSLPSPKQIPKDQDHQATSEPSLMQIPEDQGHQAFSDPSPVVESDAVSELVDGTEDGHNQELDAVTEGASIYVRHLPANATSDMLETEFKQFGAIGTGGIQVVNQRGGFGFPYGFVQFVEADAAQKAIEASPVIIGGQRVFVEEKQSTSRGNRGSGNGNRNVGVRGRGNYGYGNNYRRGGRGGRSFNRRGNEYVASLNTY